MSRYSRRQRLASMDPSQDRHTLLVASQNPDKVRELRELLTELPGEVISLADLPSPPQLSETHDSFVGNATEKAVTTAQASGYLAVADDSGLVVPALDGAPGVHSSRVAASDLERINWLLAQMQGLTGQERAAHFVCVLALADPSGKLLGTWEGYVDGVITGAPKGGGGFGYDPVFWYPPTEKTFAEMSPQEKNSVSHRGRALRAFAQDLPAILAQTAGPSAE